MMLMFLEPETTDVCQPMDQDPNAVFKSVFKGHRARSMSQDVFDQLKRGVSPMDIRMDLSWTAQKVPFTAAVKHAILAVHRSSGMDWTRSVT